MPAQEDVDAEYVAIIPVKNGCRFKYKIEPPFSHDEWAIKIVGAGFHCPTILVKGSLERLRKPRVRIEWLASHYLELEKVANSLNDLDPLDHMTPEDTLVMLEKTYKSEVQYFYPNEAERPKWLKEE